jgi:hypothetical protein
VALRQVLGRMTPLDRIIVLALMLVSGLLFLSAAAGPRGAEVVAERDGRIIFSAPLDQNRTVSLQGPLGTTVLAIQQGHAFLVSSPCPLKIGIRMGKISRAGQVVACVPNHLLVRIVGKAKKDRKSYDLLSR